MKFARKSAATYGHSIGIIMLDCTFQRIPGDIGNATTFPFPVQYKVVHGVPVNKIVNERDETYLPPFIEAAKELEAGGVRAITTSCGCLAYYHRILANSVRIPVFTSTLLQVPLVHEMLGDNAKVGILAADSSLLTDDLFKGVGWSIKDIPVTVISMNSSSELVRFHADDPNIDFEIIREDVVNSVKKCIDIDPDIRALVIECSNLVPYAADIQDAIQIPIFDIVTLVNMVHQATVRKGFNGYL